MVQVTPNLIAYAALLVWPLISLILFLRRPVDQALIWTILGAHLLLPVGTAIKFEGIPALDKASLPNLMALIGCLFVASRRGIVAPTSALVKILLLVLIGSPFITSMLNADSVLAGEFGRIIPGIGPYEAVSAVVSQFIVFVPFLLARRVLQHPKSLRAVLMALVISGLIYTVPMLIEIRLSPQLHTWIYGYLPHEFAQQVRDGGFRPVVFLGHGLLVAFFLSTAVVATAALQKAKATVFGFPAAYSLSWLASVLLLCKSLASFVYAATLVPLVLFTRPRFQARIAVMFATIALAYPLLRMTNLFPVNAIVSAAGVVSAERQQSIEFRFDQEEAILKRSSERLWFGWGRFGRGRIYDNSGKDLTVTDGYWIILVNTFGVFGFLAAFGLLALTVFRSASALKRSKFGNDTMFLSAVCLIVSITMVDLLPNASMSSWGWLLAGALLGRSDMIIAQSRRNAVQVPAFQPAAS